MSGSAAIAGFRRRIALRIGVVSLLLAALAAPLAWYVAREQAEEAVVAFATEESGRLLRRFDALDLSRPDAERHAVGAAHMIAGGLFDIVEIYDAGGRRLAEARTPEGDALESVLPHHPAPRQATARYESVMLAGDIWALRVFVPLHRGGEVGGYMEGVRAVPAWQRRDILVSASLMAALAALAALLCGAALYPVVMRLALDNLRQAEAVARQERTRELLHNILPASVADELAESGRVEPVRHEAASILFTDFSGFTQAVGAMPAARMVAELNDIFAAFDAISDACGIEKIKTIGDAYMAVAGVPRPSADHAQRAVRAGLRMIDYLDRRNRDAAFKWRLRVGVHSGPVVAGVVGSKRYAFDVWGDTVNVAARMESAGEVGRVNVSAYTCDLIRADFVCQYRGQLSAKGKGDLDMYFVERETSG